MSGTQPNKNTGVGDEAAFQAEETRTQEHGSHGTDWAGMVWDGRRKP